MPRDPGKLQTYINLTPDDRARAERIAAEWGRRTGGMPTMTAAIRWALRELDGRLVEGSERVAAERGPRER